MNIKKVAIYSGIAYAAYWVYKTYAMPTSTAVNATQSAGYADQSGIRNTLVNFYSNIRKYFAVGN